MKDVAGGNTCVVVGGLKMVLSFQWALKSVYLGSSQSSNVRTHVQTCGLGFSLTSKSVAFPSLPRLSPLTTTQSKNIMT